MEHELKTDPKPFQAVWAGEKFFELRFNDRNYKVGDYLVLKETVNKSSSVYTGRRIITKITGVYSGEEYGIMKGWVALSFNKIRRALVER